jgi:hypothetical protein
LEQSLAVFQLLQDRASTQASLLALENLIRARESETADVLEEWENQMRLIFTDPHHPMRALADLPQGFLESHGLSMELIRGVLADISARVSREQDLAGELDRDSLEQIRVKISEAIRDAHFAEAAIHAMNLEESEKELVFKDFSGIFYEEICEPHGMIDRIVESIKAIGKGE